MTMSFLIRTKTRTYKTRSWIRHKFFTQSPLKLATLSIYSVHKYRTRLGRSLKTCATPNQAAPTPLTRGLLCASAVQTSSVLV